LSVSPPQSRARQHAARSLSVAVLAASVFVAAESPAVAVPAGTLVAPSSEAPVSGLVDFRLSSPEGNARAAFYVDGRLRDADPRRPFLFGDTGLFDTRQLSNGKHRLSLRVNRSGRTETMSRVITVRNAARSVARAAAADRTAPSVWWKSPTSGQRVSGVRSLSGCAAVASDNVGVHRIEFFVDATRLPTEYFAPYNCTWDTRKFSEGSHVLKAVAYDRAGNRRVGSVSVVVDNVPDVNPAPLVAWSTPAAGATVSGMVEGSACQAQASDANGVDRVEFAIAGRALNVERIAPYTCVVDTTTVADGSHTLTATAYDALGAKSSSSVNVTVKNTVSAPVTSPTPTPTPTPTPEVTPEPTPVKITAWRPVGSAPLSDADAASRITRVAENRPGNVAANAYKPSATEVQAFLNNERNADGRLPAEYNRLYAKVTGGFTGTTDEILQWGAQKWGIPEDWVRAQAVHESWWRHETKGDRQVVRDVLRYPAHSRIDGDEVFQSLGLMQIRWDHPDGNRAGTGTEALRWKSTAFNVDFALATVRYYYDGLCSWCSTGYASGQQWESLAGWYSPAPWKNSGQLSYITNVKRHLTERTWAKAGF